MSDRNELPDTEQKRGTPSTATSETARPEPALDDDLTNGRENQSAFGSEGSGGETSPARPHDRKNRS